MENIHLNPDFVSINTFEDTNSNHSKGILINAVLSMAPDEFTEVELLTYSFQKLEDLTNELNRGLEDQWEF